MWHIWMSHVTHMNESCHMASISLSIQFFKSQLYRYRAWVCHASLIHMCAMTHVCRRCVFTVVYEGIHLSLDPISQKSALSLLWIYCIQLATWFAVTNSHVQVLRIYGCLWRQPSLSISIFLKSRCTAIVDLLYTARYWIYCSMCRCCVFTGVYEGIHLSLYRFF